MYPDPAPAPKARQESDTTQLLAGDGPETKQCYPNPFLRYNHAVSAINTVVQQLPNIPGTSPLKHIPLKVCLGGVILALNPSSVGRWALHHHPPPRRLCSTTVRCRRLYFLSWSTHCGSLVLVFPSSCFLISGRT
jgi:hypothetical protein